MNQLDQRPIIALDFSTRQEVEDFLRFFPKEEKIVCENRNGIVLPRRT